MESSMAPELAYIESKTKILLNGLPVAYPISGVGQYTLQLGKALEALLGDGRILWFGRDGSGQRGWDSNREDPIFMNQVRHHLKKGLRKVPGLKKLVRFGRSHQFRSYVKRVRPSVYHETNYTPFCFEEGPTILTIYDLSFIRHPEWHPKDRVKHFEKYCLKQLSKVDAIITISEFSKKEIINLLGVNPAKMHVTSLGVDRNFTPEGGKMEGLPNEYVLFLGNLEPRKNLVTLLTAYRSFPRSLRDRHPLVIAGASGWHTHELIKALHLFQNDEKPILTGYVPQKFLPDLYRGASIFVYPSLYEGFGLPVLEAMACGVPVVTSHTTSLPEVVGDAGILVNPNDADEWREVMVKVLEDPKIKEEMSEKGLERAKLFSWEKCARGTLSVYQKVLGEGR
jgi:glycosyltransferase involved in cell wall biosynthesis